MAKILVKLEIIPYKSEIDKIHKIKQLKNCKVEIFDKYILATQYFKDIEY